MRSDREPTPRIVVIGSGIGGTAVTALLASTGLPVTLLEKNIHIGGSCAGYEKQGFHVDFGTHMFTRGPRGPLGEVLRRIGRPEAIEFRRTHDVAEIRYPARDGSGAVSRLALPAQLHRGPVLVQRLARAMGLGPRDALQTGRLFLDMLTMSDAVADAWLSRTFSEYIATFTDNPRVRSIVSFLLGLYFVVPPWEVSAGESIYCFQRMMRDNFLSYPVGGASAVPSTYARRAAELGAQVRTRAGVRKILITAGKVHGVLLQDGSSIDADIVISTSSVRTTALELCEPEALPAAYLARAAELTGSLSGVQLKIGLRRRLVDAGCLIGGFGRADDMLNASDNAVDRWFAQCLDGAIPDRIPFYCPVPTNFDDALAPPGHQLLTACMLAPSTDIATADPAARWEEALLDTLRAVIPGLDDEIVFVDRATTSWMEHWLGKQFGPVISTGQTPSQVGAGRPTIATPVDGLYIAGDGAGGRGVGTELAADSAMECAEIVLDRLRQPWPVAWEAGRRGKSGLSSLVREFVRPGPVVRPSHDVSPSAQTPVRGRR